MKSELRPLKSYAHVLVCIESPGSKGIKWKVTRRGRKTEWMCECTITGP